MVLSYWIVNGDEQIIRCPNITTLSAMMNLQNHGNITKLQHINCNVTQNELLCGCTDTKTPPRPIINYKKSNNNPYEIANM